MRHVAAERKTPHFEAKTLNEKIHAPLERDTTWTSRMNSSIEKADSMYMKKSIIKP
jgi:hypothetical protein